MRDFISKLFAVPLILVLLAVSARSELNAKTLRNGIRIFEI